MAVLSISKAWDETRDILARNGKLLTTVAAAMILLPQVVVGVVTGQAADTSSPGLSAGVLMLIAGLIGVVGQLAIARLALGTKVSVAESIGHGLRRAPAFIGSLLLILLGVIAFFLVAGAILIGLGAIDGTVTEPRPRDVVIILLVLFIPMLIIAVRLFPTVPVATTEDQGPVGILTRSWALTRGHFWRLLGFIAIFIIAALVTAAAVGAVGGAIIALLFGIPEPFTLGALVIALLMGLVQAALVLVYVVMIARIYVQLAGDGAAEASVPTTGS
ncbi:MAG TPA: glycerophosphoryl diester phosphodiesterase membrane domain-containing protein [Sphingomicrobium sp.]|nr:glycerophosphoryl diester phosphodiesterase membrane domain-containing protein [Sphingomicrobium sp.]